MKKMILLVVDVQNAIVMEHPHEEEQVLDNINSAFDLNYKVLVPEQTNTSFDNPYMQAQQLIAYYNTFIWKDRYAKVLPMAEALEHLQQQ